MADEETVTQEVEESQLSEQEQQMAKLKEAIAVHSEDTGRLRKKLTITVPATTIEERRGEQFSDLKRDSTVPGFRKGHAPMKLVEKRFGTEVNAQLSSQLLSSSYLAALEKEDIKAIGDPLIWIQDAQADDGSEKLVAVEEAFETMKLPDDGDFSYSCEIEVRPEFKIPELEGITIHQPQTEIGTKEIDEHIDRLRAMRGHYEPLEKGKVQADDLVIGHLTVTCDGHVWLDEENCQLAARPQAYSGIVMEGLGEALVGAAVGDCRTCAGQAPDDHSDEKIRGKTAEVEITIAEIKRLRLPELNDEFLSGLGFEGTAELKDWVKANLYARQSEDHKRQKREQAYKYLIDNTDMDLPDGLSHRQTERIVARRMLDLARRGVPEPEILKQADAIKVGAEKDAIKDLQLHFILEDIAEQWDVTTSEDEINTQIAVIARQQNRRFDRVRDDLIRNKQLAALHTHVRDEKIVDRIIASANIVEAGPPGPKVKTTKTTKKKATTRKKTKKKATKKSS